MVLDLFIAWLRLEVFFFSSRRRHTSWPRDWSSDVCSSDLHREKRPPTQSHISKMLSLPTPKATAFSTLEDTAIKCRLVVLSLPPLFKNHVRAVLAFSVVSGLVKLLDATTYKVLSSLT